MATGIPALQRIRQFIKEVVRPAIHARTVPLEIAAHEVRGEPIPLDEARGRPFRPFAVGEKWGGMWDTTWFRMRGVVPIDWAGAEVGALIHLGGSEMVGFSAEGLVWDVEGVPVQGLHHRHRELILLAPAGGGEEVEFFVEAAANPIPKWHRLDWPLLLPDYGGPSLYAVEQAELATVDREVEGLWLDMTVLLEVADQVPDRADEVTAALAEAVDVFSSREHGAGAARAVLKPALASPSASTHRVTAVGHAHIDSAWLWPVRETKRKCARTFANQLRLMERYPEHRFVCSQAAQYQWMKDGYPEIYRQIAHRVAEGRWEPVGGMWVESDSNVPSGESLVRQFVYGKRFFADEFGIETHEMWIPDVFGYSAALPQIAAQAGVTALVTQKMSWNDTNVFPHSTFWWEGHDGSRVLAHFPPVDTYNGEFSVTEVARSEGNNKDPGRLERSLYPFGYGDGGGGPTAAMVERARRMVNLGGLPHVEIGTAEGFLRDAAAEASDLATWVGELYLEAHRATLTTHADVKTGNRRNEEALRAAEMWSVAAGLDRRGELDRAWKLLLFLQFHDILPGSSIHWVYDDAAREHGEASDIAAAVTVEARAALAPPLADGKVVFNAASHDRTEVVEVDGHLAVVSAPACGWAPVDPGFSGGGESGSAPVPVEVADFFMENEYLRVTWDGDGLLTSVWDREAEREVLAAGERGNLFQVLEDHPKAFDAWDVDRDAFDQVTDLVKVDGVEVVERDPLRAGVRFARRFGASAITQVVRLTAGSRRLEFHTEVDWHEDHRFLKVAFPVAVRSPRATYEIQHGHIERPTVANTSWDAARFEVCGHRWADLSEAGYGVALLNNGKYGYDIHGHVMRLSLLRAPGYPDPAADRGVHHFAYALLPHLGDFRRPGRVVEEAEAFNLPLAVVPGRGGGQVVTVDRPGVSVEAVKWADRSDGVVVRLCEVWGSRGPARVRVGFPFGRVTRTDLLERDLSPVPSGEGVVELELRPFELVTLRFSAPS